MVLEFLALKNEYSESALEGDLIHHRKQFPLELGNDFAFIARQKWLRAGDEWYRFLKCPNYWISPEKRVRSITCKRSSAPTRRMIPWMWFFTVCSDSFRYEPISLLVSP